MIEGYLNIYRHSATYFLITKITEFIMRLWRGSFCRHIFYDEWGFGFNKTIAFNGKLAAYANESVMLKGPARIMENLEGFAGRLVEGSLLLRLTRGFFGSLAGQDILVLFTILAIPILPTKFILALCVLSVGLFALKLVTGRSRLNLGTQDFFICLFALLIGVSIPISYIPSNSFMMGSVYILFILFYFVVKSTVDTKEKLFTAISVLMFSGLAVSAFGILQRITGRGFVMTAAWIDSEMFSESSMRIYSTLDNPNVLGQYLIFVIMFSFAGIYYFKGFFYKAVSVAICLTSGLCMVFTLSRGAWLGLIFAFALYALIKDRRLIWLGVLAILLAPMIMPETIMQRILSIGNLEDSSSAYRLNIWLASVNMIKDYWPIGIGLGTKVFVYIYQKFSFAAVYAPHAHNLFLQVLIDLGISGLALLAAVIFLTFRNFLSGLKHTTDNFLTAAGAAICSALGGYLLQGLTDNVWYNYRVVAFFWVITGLSGALALCVRKEKTNEEV